MFYRNNLRQLRVKEEKLAAFQKFIISKIPYGILSKLLIVHRVS
jgi:hypothetical protein